MTTSGVSCPRGSQEKAQNRTKVRRVLEHYSLCIQTNEKVLSSVRTQGKPLMSVPCCELPNTNTMAGRSHRQKPGAQHPETATHTQLTNNGHVG